MAAAGGPVHALPYRGRFGAARPPALRELALPPAPMPSRAGLRPLKAWRYVGLYGPELMICAAVVRIGPARQAFWAVWDRARQRLLKRTRLRGGHVVLEPGRLRVDDGPVQLNVALAEADGVESVCATGESYAWTRKQGGVPARGTAEIDGVERELACSAVIDDTAAYYARHTQWRWSAGVGRSEDGRDVAWNLVVGVNDPPANSERTVWLDGAPREPPRCSFAADLSSVDELRFHPEATRERTDNLLVVRSSYRQPFGTFSGTLPGAIVLAEGFGVMEAHEAWW